MKVLGTVGSGFREAMVVYPVVAETSFLGHTRTRCTDPDGKAAEDGRSKVSVMEESNIIRPVKGCLNRAGSDLLPNSDYFRPTVPRASAAAAGDVRSAGFGRWLGARALNPPARWDVATRTTAGEKRDFALDAYGTGVHTTRGFLPLTPFSRGPAMDFSRTLLRLCVVVPILSTRRWPSRA